jgi:hypothetical protein
MSQEAMENAMEKEAMRKIEGMRMIDYRCPTHGAFRVAVTRERELPAEMDCQMIDRPDPMTHRRCAEPSPLAVPRRETCMDGDLHIEGECCGEDSILGHACAGCGGRVHGQPVYGGIEYRCEGCEFDRCLWAPRGSSVRCADGIGWSMPFPREEILREDPIAYETIDRAAIERGDVVYSAPRPGRHHDVMREMRERDVDASIRQGFMTSLGRFVDREEALGIATRAGQIASKTNPAWMLFSEDMW